MAVWKYTISGDTPSKKNTKKFQRSTGRTYYTKPFLNWRETALWELKTQEKPDTPIEHVNGVILRFYRKTDRRADLTNLAEAPMDALVKMEILADDDWKCVPQVELVYEGKDKDNPRVEIEIFE
jgi:Holliday junction resolvase RusA-like endonuclease